MSNVLYKLAAFATTPDGGNPAGVWIGENFPPEAEMQKIASDVGFSETAFVTPRSGFKRSIRYFSPVAEVPFCGHATIATGVVLGEQTGCGTYTLSTRVGEIPVAVADSAGRIEASVTSVTPTQKAIPDGFLEKILTTLDWKSSELSTHIAPVLAYAGNWHLVLATNTRERLELLEYNFADLKALMLQQDLTTLQLVWQADHSTFHSRNPFPVGGVVEDPATGAAAAALGGYLRDAQLVAVPGTITIRQGACIGRPGILTVVIPENGGIVVRGTAVHLI